MHINNFMDARQDLEDILSFVNLNETNLTQFMKSTNHKRFNLLLTD
jgi:hypothetical protein